MIFIPTPLSGYLQKYSLLRFIIPFIVLLSVYYPILMNFKYFPSSIDGQVILDLQSDPDIAIENKLRSIDTSQPRLPYEKDDLSKAADNLLLGGIVYDGYGSNILDVPFDRNAVTKGNSFWQLQYSSFLVPKIFHEAYLLDGRQEYLRAALEFMIEWLDYERNLLKPEGFVWNDHAIASRASVLCDVWLSYRRSALFNEEDAERLLQLARLNINYLTRETLYNYRTNHGTMQSLSLLKLGACFPSFPDVEEIQKTAIHRLLKQLKFYVGEEGIILEHSIGYHIFGMNLLQEFSVLLKILESPVMAHIGPVQAEMAEFLKNVLRPDGSVPLIGDTFKDDLTGLKAELLKSLEGFPENLPALNNRLLLYPKSGYAFIHLSNNRPNGKEVLDSQMAAFWGNVPHMGHKHSDDASIHFWSNGVDWLTASGYWPYADLNRKVGISWGGSNAPHFSDEEDKRGRYAFLSSFGLADDLFFFEIERRPLGGGIIRRQVFAPFPNVWITFDSFAHGQEKEFSVIWLTDTGNQIFYGDGDDAAKILNDNSTTRLDAALVNSEGEKFDLLKNEHRPGAGWMVHWSSRKPTLSSALLSTIRAKEGWSLSAFSVEQVSKERSLENLELLEQVDARNWKISLSYNGQDVILSRLGDSVKALISGQPSKNLRLTQLTETEQTDRAAYGHYFETKELYGKTFVPHWKYRVRMVKFIALLIVLDVLAGLAIQRSFNGRYGLLLVISPVFWFSFGFWLNFQYFLTESSMTSSATMVFTFIISLFAIASVITINATKPNARSK